MINVAERLGNEVPPAPPATPPGKFDVRVVACGISLAILLVLFAWPLSALVSLALKTDLHSHVLLIPFITGYLLRVMWKQLPQVYHSSWIVGALAALVGGSILGVSVVPDWVGSAGPTAVLAAKILALICFIHSAGFFFLGNRWMRAAAFPMAFLLFSIPLPESAVHWLEHELKVASAEAAAMMFDATGLPYLRSGLVFEIPGIVIEVADECSGIRSSYVLFITSLLASYLFLQSPWRRGVLALVVIPLGIIRNGFRILVIAWMCVEIGPEMIHSIVHRRGGPLFFVLSLVPLLGLLCWLRRSEVAGRSVTGTGRPEL